MAKFTVVGFDDVEKKLLARNEKTDRAAVAMLEAGAKVVVEAQKFQINMMGIWDTWALHDSIKATQVKGDGAARYVYIQPTGKDKKGTSNATKGFIAQYGKKNVPARPWMTAANAQCSTELHETMRAKWEEVMSDDGGGGD